MNKLGRFVTETNLQFLTDTELQEWNDAVQEYQRKIESGDLIESLPPKTELERRFRLLLVLQSTTMCESTVWSWTSPLRWQKPKEQIAYCYWLVLSGTSHQSVRALKSARPLDLHFPIVVCARADDGHPPVSRSVAQDVFNYRLKF
jgi:hypothetical protein